MTAIPEPPREEPRGPSLGQRTVTAAQWQMAASVSKGVLQFGVMILLARLLTPEDFGLAALAMIVVGFAEMVVDLGLGSALVQRREYTERHVRVSFTASTLFGLALALVVVTGAPLFGALLRSEALPQILRWQAIGFVFAGSAVTARSLLERRLEFRGIFFVTLASYGAGYALVALTLALMGFGVWSLVFGALVQGLVGSVTANALARHSMKPLLARAELGELLDYGMGVTLNMMVVYATYHGDNLVIGRWLGPAALGLYSRAFQLMHFPLTHMQSVTWNVLFSAFSRLQDERERAAAAYLKGVQFTSLVVAPLMAGMIVAGPHLIVGLYGPQWAEATRAFQILCAAGLLRSVYSMTGALTYGFDRVYAEFRRQMMFAVLVIAGALVGSAWGITGAAVGVSGAVGAMYLAMAQLGRSIVGYRWRDFFAVQLTGVLLALPVAGAAGVVRLALEGMGWGSGPILVAVVLACVAAVPIGLFLLPPGLRPVELFRTLDPSLARLPAALRLPVRRMMRLPAEGAGASP